MCNTCYRVVSLLVVLTRHFDSDRTYSATASGRQPSEPIPPVGLVGLHFLIEPPMWIYRGSPGAVLYRYLSSQMRQVVFTGLVVAGRRVG